VPIHLPSLAFIILLSWIIGCFSGTDFEEKDYHYQRFQAVKLQKSKK